MKCLVSVIPVCVLVLCVSDSLQGDSVRREEHMKQPKGSPQSKREQRSSSAASCFVFLTILEQKSVSPENTLN